jgi:hypothetical protein
MPVSYSAVQPEILLKNEAEVLDHVEAIVTLLDSQFVIPGTDIRFGLDSLVGLVPVVGDFLGLALSAYVYKRLSELGLSRVTRGRMIVNILIDAGVGTVPIAGDVFDVAFRANKRNLELAKKSLARRRT